VTNSPSGAAIVHNNTPTPTKESAETELEDFQESILTSAAAAESKDVGRVENGIEMRSRAASYSRLKNGMMDGERTNCHARYFVVVCDVFAVMLLF